MADHSKPTVTSLYSNFVAELDARLDDLAVMLDPARTTTSNIPTGAIRWASASSKWQLWNGSAWVDLAATYAINALTASSAAKWTTARTLALSGDVTGSTTLDGSANKTITATLSNTGVSAGTYKSVTVDAKGRVTGATNPTTLAGYGITDAVPSADVSHVPAASKIVKATADGPIDLGWLDTAVARELRMLAVGVNPSLDLNFAKQEYRHYDGAEGLVSHPMTPFVYFTRSTTASYVGADGLLKTAAINEPRIEYDPITGECKGLLIEESRTNLLLYSEAFDNGAWNKTRSSIISDCAMSPSGTLGADRLIGNTETGNHRASQSTTLSAQTAYEISVFLKKDTISKAKIYNYVSSSWVELVAAYFDLDAGTVISGAGNISDVGNGWYRCSILATTSPTAATGGVAIELLNDDGVEGFTGDGTSGLYIWGAQLEQGSFPTSYIKTEASAVTRSADNASVTGANFSSWYRHDEGTFIIDWDIFDSNTSRIFTVTDGYLISNALFLSHGSAGTAHYWEGHSGSSPQWGTRVDVPDGGRCACAYKRNDTGLSVNGSVVTVDTTCEVPVGVNILTIGYASSNNLNGHISRLTYWPKRLTNTQLQELSK